MKTDQFKIQCYDRVTEIMERGRLAQLESLERKLKKEQNRSCKSPQEGA